MVDRKPKKRKSPRSVDDSLRTKSKPKNSTFKRNRPGSSVPQTVAPRQLQVKATVHRFRHARHIPRAILRLASTPYIRGVAPSPYLAVSREGGSVELVSVNEKWKCVGEVEGLRNRNVDAMVWVCSADDENSQLKSTTTTGTKTTTIMTQHFCEEHKSAEQIHSKRRLIGASRDGTIFEIDFKTKRHTHVIGSGGGSVFCLTSLYSEPDLDGTGQKHFNNSFVAAGCEDGSVRIFNAASNNSPGLELICTLPSVGSAILSIAWTGGAGNSMVGSTLYAGVADGTIRKFECDSFVSSSPTKDKSMEPITSTHYRWKPTTRMTVENRGRSTPTKVWALKSLACGTVVSSDSMGSIQFWDGRSGTLLQSFEHNSEKADVLDLAVNYNQSKVMASGINSKIVCIERNDTAGGKKNWVMTAQRRMHRNDVNSLAYVYMTDEKGAAGYGSKNKEANELLCSGGLDTRVFSLATENLVRERPKIVYKYPQTPRLNIARKARILTIMRTERVDFFQLSEKVDIKKCRPRVTLDESKAYLGSITISGLHNLVAMDITEDGKFLAVSDAASLYMFSLRYNEIQTENGTKKTVLSSASMDLPLFANTPCSSIKFLPDNSRRLICAPTIGDVKVLKVNEENDDSETHGVGHNIKVEHTFKTTSPDPPTVHNFPITDISISPDCRYIAIHRNTMRTGSITILSIIPDYAHWYELPCPEAPYSCAKFIGGEDGDVKPALVVGCSNNSFYIYDVEQKCPTDWSNDLGIPASDVLPKDFTQQLDIPVRLATNPRTPNKFLMGGQNWFCPVDLDMPLPETLMYHPDDHISAKKQNRTKFEHEAKNSNLAICLLYTGIIFMEFLSEDELVVVEQPWEDIVNSLPGALERKRYGS